MISIAPYDIAWAERFAELGGRLRDALGEVALRRDHVGSTALVGLAAKPVVDIQVSVAALEPRTVSRDRWSALDSSTVR
jgi:GrpB-like predicted nucleotidyltransferase (UPF0157 family)